MKFLLLISLICGLINASSAALSIGIYKDPKHPGKCVVGDVIMSPGDEAKDPHSSCGRMLCDKNSFVEFQTCGSIGPPEGFELGEPVEPLAPYPKCCERKFVPIKN